MKIAEIKSRVFKVSNTKNTKQLKADYPEITNGKDLRFKGSWSEILEQFGGVFPSKNIFNTSLDEMDKMLKEHLVKIGKNSGLTDLELEVEWQKIKLESLL
ncbi:hypothetical protein IQ225_07065 [Synechocystis salina LEGE 06155]|nr:hypothetical protein [Synechocystis salina LEGE 06155]